jgi:hypothetical protein
MKRAKGSLRRKADGRVSNGGAAMGHAQVKPPTTLRTSVSEQQLEPTEAQPLKLHHRMAGIVS